MDNSTALPQIRAVEAVPVQQDGQMLFLLRDPFHYSDAVLTISPMGALIVQLLDGKNSLVDIQTTLSRPMSETSAPGASETLSRPMSETLSRPVREIFPAEKILEVVRVLDECYFLDNDRYARRKKEVEEAFGRLQVRPASLAKRSYPENPNELRSLLDTFFSQPDTAAITGSNNGDETIGIVAPHIDFTRGGSTYPPAYRPLARSNADTFIILGISHAGGATPLIPTRKDFETPFGRAETDRELLDILENNLAGCRGWDRIYSGEYAHAHEHSIEFQVVFLQYLLAGKRPFRILPILCAFSHEEVQEEFHVPAGSAPPVSASGASSVGVSDSDPAPQVPAPPASAGPIRSFLRALSSAIGESGRRVAFIAGVDFAHVGAQFGDAFQVQEKELAFLRERDEQMMAILGAGNPEEFHRFISDEGNSRRVCGYPALYSLLSMLPKEARNEGRVLKYGQWPDPNGTVTFGSLAFSVKK